MSGDKGPNECEDCGRDHFPGDDSNTLCGIECALNQLLDLLKEELPKLREALASKEKP